MDQGYTVDLSQCCRGPGETCTTDTHGSAGLKAEKAFFVGPLGPLSPLREWSDLRETAARWGRGLPKANGAVVCSHVHADISDNSWLSSL